jgi:hypothetical protein
MLGFGEYLRSLREVHEVFQSNAPSCRSCDHPRRLDSAGDENPISEIIQQDGRIRRWAQIDEMDGRFLRVVLLAHGETVHNAFFDRTFKP